MQGKLATLLKGIPVVWLDAVAQCFDVEIEGSRKDREKKIAETLCDPATLRQIVESSLEPAEREILDRLLGQTARVSRRRSTGNTETMKTTDGSGKRSRPSRRSAGSVSTGWSSSARL